MNRIFIVSTLALLLIFSSLFSYDGKKKHRSLFFEDVDVDIDENAIILTYQKGRYETIEFTENDRLFIDDKEIILDKHQRELVREFRLEMMKLTQSAAEIGMEGAKIGLEGAKIGIKALGKVLKLLSPEYDAEDLEEEIGEETEELEIQTEKIEEMAEKLEESVDLLHELRDELRAEIPALNDTDWF